MSYQNTTLSTRTVFESSATCDRTVDKQKQKITVSILKLFNVDSRSTLVYLVYGCTARVVRSLLTVHAAGSDVSSADLLVVAAQ